MALVFVCLTSHSIYKRPFGFLDEKYYYVIATQRNNLETLRDHRQRPFFSVIFLFFFWLFLEMILNAKDTNGKKINNHEDQRRNIPMAKTTNCKTNQSQKPMTQKPNGKTKQCSKNQWQKTNGKKQIIKKKLLKKHQ